jgi:tetratricopeptide (TPR) repeat protein
MKMRRPLLLFAVLMLLPLPRALGQGEAPAAARAFDEGSEHYQKGQYDQAIRKFLEGWAASRDPVFLFNIAQAHRKAGRPREALAFFEHYLREAPAAANRREVERAVAALRSGPLDGTPLGEEPEPEPLAEEAADPAAEAFALAKEGRALVKSKRFKEGLAKLKEAVARGEQAGIAAEDQAELHYAYGLALAKAEEDQAAVAALRKACALNPRDAEMQLDLATALSRIEDHSGTIAAAEAALRLGLKGDEAREARTMIKSARDDRLHERLSFDATVSFGYDSNILQSALVETIAGRFTGGRGQQTRDMQLMALRSLREDIAAQFRTPKEAQQEPDLPLSIYLDLSGRVVGNRKVSLGAGYRFSQTFMTLATYDHDAYNFQEHAAVLRLPTEPLRWLSLTVRAEGFANFSGLKDFEAFQGGIRGGLDAIFRESRRFQTRLTFTHAYRASFDRTVVSYPASSGALVAGTSRDTGSGCPYATSYSNADLDGNRDDLGLLQDLRVKWLRARLGYYLHSDRSGVLQFDVPYQIPVTNPITMQQVDATIGCYRYRAALSYLGHEAVASTRFLLPRQFEILVGARYEFRRYDPYTVVFYPFRRPDGTQDQPTSLLDTHRQDHRIMADLSISKSLPLGFSIDLTYSFLYNKSNIEHGLDNRTYMKHVATLWANYSF